MKDKIYQSIVNAIDILVAGKPVRTNGKVTAVNVAKEAGIGKASLYRYFEECPELRESYDAVRKNGINVEEVVPETVQQAYRLLKEEVKRLRSDLADSKRNADKVNKLKAHQIQLLWLENKRLENEVSRLTAQLSAQSNVVPLGRSLGKQ